MIQNLKKMNKRAELTTISVILIIVAVISGFFIADKLGLFASFIPSVGQPAGTDSLVNPVYYGNVINNSNFACASYIWYTSHEENDGCNICHASSPTITLTTRGQSCPVEYPVCNSYYRKTIQVESGKRLCGFKGSSSNLLDCSTFTASNGVQFPRILDSCTTGTDCGPQMVPQEVDDGCNICATSTSDITLTTRGQSCPSNYPSCTIYYKKTVQDPHTGYNQSFKVACYNGDIYNVSCNSFTDKIKLFDCPTNQVCNYFSNYNTPDGFQAALKCGTNLDLYKPNQNLCVGNILYSTSSDGKAISSSTCGFACSNNACIDCQDGTKRCSPSPTSTSDVDICSGGTWIPQNTKCSGIQQCSQGTCTSDFNIGDKKCNVKQPQILNSQSQWDDDGEVCDLQCNEISRTETTCTLQCTPTGYSCAGGILYECLNEDRDNQQYNRGVCSSGYCTTDNSKCLPAHSIGDKYCSDGDVYTGISSGNNYDLFGGVSGDLFKTCSNGCLNGECILATGCSGHLGQDICSDGFTKKTCSSDGQTYTFTQNCGDLGTGGFCNSTTKQCQLPPAACTGTSFCANGLNIKQCNLGVIGNILYSCNNLGCTTDSNGNPKCIDGCTIEDSFSCQSGNSYKCTEVTDGSNQLLLNLSQTCGSRGCNALTGICTTECTPNINKCASDNYIHSCNSDSTLGSIIDTCNGKGCSTNTNSCNNICTSIGFRCSNSNSIECYRNETNAQLLERTTACGINGCGSDGRCNALGQPNSHVCISQDLYETDSNGYAESNPIKTCNTELKRNGLQPKCLSSTDLIDYIDCVVCDFNGQYICLNKNYYRCGDIYQGTAISGSSVNCEVGCSTNGNNFCDNLDTIISETQNFVLGEGVKVTGTLQGSQTGNGVIATNIKGTLTGSGQNKEVTASSSSSGIFDLNFGEIPLGNYNVVIEITEYNKTFNIVAKVSNDYKIEKAESVALIKYPGINPSINLKITGGDGIPQDIIILGSYSGIRNVDISYSSVVGKWILTVDGDPGIYHINVSAVEKVTNAQQDPQDLVIEIRNPTLAITSNLPVSAKPGKQEIQVKVSGPTSKDQPSAGLVPDTITATINNQNVELKNQGSGSYIIEQTFTDLGTYTLQVDAVKAGYDAPDTFSKSITISSSGKETTPGTGNVTTTTCSTNSDCLNGYKCSNGVCVSSGNFDTNTWIIIGVVLIGGYFLLRKKK